MTPRTIVITGGSGKIGSTLVRYFLNQGDVVIATCRTSESADRMRQQHNHESRFLLIRTDFMERASINRLIAELDGRGLRPDCLVNNARSRANLNQKNTTAVSRDDFANEYLLDVIAPYELTMAFADQKSSNLRCVVNIGSQYGLVAVNPSLYDNPNQQSPIHYSVAKAAVVHLTRELAVRLAAQAIRVNCVAYGGVDGRVTDIFKSRYAQLCPSGRMLLEEDLSGPVDSLLSERFSGVTGHTLVVDGGWSIW